MASEHLFLAIWAIGILLIWPPMIWWSVHSRRVDGYPIIPRLPDGALYSEDKAGGRESGKLGGASNCLLVAVTSREFMIAPRFPFNMVAPRGVVGLEHTMPKALVVGSLHRGWGGTNVRVCMRDANGPVLDLKLRRPEAFLAALIS